MISLIQPTLNQHDPNVIRSEDWQLNHIDWQVDKSSTFNNGESRYIVDSTTGRRYFNESRTVVRLKCLYPGLLFISLLSVAVGTINIVYRSAKVLSGYHFWSDKTSEKTYQFTAEIHRGDSMVCHVFKARFDDLGVMNSLVDSEDVRLVSAEKHEDGTYKLTMQTLSGVRREVKAQADADVDSILSNQDDTKQRKITLLDLKEVGEKYDVKARCIECAQDIVRTVASLFVFIPLTLAALYGLWKPYEARKLISSIALAVCGTNQVAACFAPDPSFHALGGDINKQHSF